MSETVTTLLEGYCAIETDTPGDYEFVRMDTLRPGDLFVFVEEQDPRFRIFMDEARPLEERRAAMEGLLADGKRFRFTEAQEHVPGRAGCRAAEREDA